MSSSLLASPGSDISVFFSNGAAYCTGRGEVVEDVPPPIPLDTPMLLVGREAGCCMLCMHRSLCCTTS